MRQLNKRELTKLISEDKKKYQEVLILLQMELQEVISRLCLQRNPDEKTYLQGQVCILNEYIKLLT